MTIDEWKNSTSVKWKVRSRELVALDNAILVYESTSHGADLVNLRQAFEQWKRSKGSGEEWKHSIRNQPADNPVEKLEASLVAQESTLRQDRIHALPALRSAAGIVYDTYQPWIPDDYRGALETIFIAAAQDMYCYRWYASHSDWRVHVDNLSTEGHAILATDTITGNTPTVNHVWDGTHGRFLRYNTRAQIAPLNRRIEFHDCTNHHSLTHEMVHWVCHENFRREVSDENIKEGFTEWLTRNALNKMDEGGYGRIMIGVKNAIKAGEPSEDDVKRAYFQGVNISTTGQALVAHVAQERLDETSKRQRIDQCLVTMNRPVGGAKYRDPASAGPVFVNTMKDACKGVPTEQLRELLNDYPRWFAFLSGTV